MSKAEKNLNQKLIFFIVDGFSNYYLNEYQSSLIGVDELLKNGSRAEYVTPVFPSFSLPNYYSMFTGLTVENHGMISNIMYDSEWREMFEIGMANRDRWFSRAPEPAWIKASKQKIKTSMYWPWFVNCDVSGEVCWSTYTIYLFQTPSSRGEHLHYYEPESEFNKHHGKPEFVTWMNEKFNKIVTELQESSSQFIIIYWPSLDNISHEFGPTASETVEELKLVDSMLLNLQNKLSEANLWSSVNLIVVSDHGQTYVPTENRIFLEDYCDTLENIEVICEKEPVKYIYPLEGKTYDVYQMLKNAHIPYVSVYLNDDVPDHFAYKKAKCCPPILLLAEPGYSICIKSIHNEFLDSGHYSYGIHGYDNTFQDMRAVFFARGPIFHSGVVGPPIRTLDYYFFMRHILGLNDVGHSDVDEKIASRFVTA